MRLVGKSQTINLHNISFQAFSKKKRLRLPPRKLTKNEKYITSVVFPKNTSKIVVFYKKKKVSSYEFKKPLKRKNSFGIKKIKNLLANKIERPENLFSLRDWFELQEVEWSKISSGPLPDKPFCKDFVFVVSAEDFNKTYDYFVVWVAIKGFGSSEKAFRGDDVDEEHEYWNLVSMVPTRQNVQRMKGKQMVEVFKGSLFSEFKERVESTVQVHNSKFANTEVATEWSNDFKFLGVEGKNNEVHQSPTRGKDKGIRIRKKVQKTRSHRRSRL